MTDRHGRDDVRRDARAEGFARRAVSALESGDWYGAYLSTAAWSTEHAGSWLPDVWLLMAACDVTNGHTRGTVHPLHLGLRDRIDRPGDRSILLWARGELLLSRLHDPERAQSSLEMASVDAPVWLAPLIADALTGLKTVLAAKERPEPAGRVEEVPDYAGPLLPPTTRPADGEKPILFDQLREYFTGGRLHSVV